jgi:hypothetical protein
VDIQNSASRAETSACASKGVHVEVEGEGMGIKGLVRAGHQCARGYSIIDDSNAHLVTLYGKPE